MEKIKELFVVIENKPGVLGALLGHLSKARININAIGVFQDVAKISVTDIEKARKALIRHGYQSEEREVVRLHLQDKPGAFAAVAARLGRAGINIDYCYGTVGKGQRSASVIVDVQDPDGAIAVLKKGAK